MNERALILDLDGVVFNRIPFQLIALNEYVKHIHNPSEMYLPPAEVPKIAREYKQQSPITIFERTALKRHRNRVASQRTRELIEVAAEERYDIYGNTGRKQTPEWNRMTAGALTDADLGSHFRKIFFKPSGISTRDSKLAAVNEVRQLYRNVIVVDDNPWDALPIAGVFSDVKVVLLEDLSSGILLFRAEQRNLPNLQRVGFFQRDITGILAA